MARPKRQPTRQVQNEHGMYPTVRIAPMTWEEMAKTQAQFDGLKDLDAELFAILRYASQVENASQDQGILDNARLLKTAIAHELPRLLESGDTSAAMALILTIGRLYERIYAVVNYEPNVRQVRTTTKKLRDGFAAKKGHAPEEIKNAIALYRKRLKTHPKKTAAQRWVRGETGIPESVLRYHLAKREPHDQKNF